MQRRDEGRDDGRDLGGMTGEMTGEMKNQKSFIYWGFEGIKGEMSLFSKKTIFYKRKPLHKQKVTPI